MDATVHVSPSKTLEHTTVVFREGRIEMVMTPTDPAKAKDLPIPAGAQTWDATGLHVYPAFIDPYVEVDAPMPDRSKPGVHWNIKVTPQRRAPRGPRR